MCSISRNKRVGLLGEEVTLRYVQQRGYRMIKKRYRTTNGEIDLIVAKKDTIVFVEVKTRSRISCLSYALSERQYQRSRRVAEEYLASREDLFVFDFQARFDAIFVNRNRVVEHIEGIC